MRSLAATSLVLLLGAPLALAQERGANERAATESQLANLKRNVELAARVPFETPVKGAPYSADVIVESRQTLADGNRISNKNVGHVYRDGEGRTRREQEGTMSVVTRSEPVVSTRKMNISIVDPVAGYSYSLDPEHKIAWRTPLGTTKELLDRVQADVLAAQRSSSSMTEQQKRAVAKKLAEASAEAERQTTDANQARANAEMHARGGGMVGYAEGDRAPLERATIDGLPVEGRKTSKTIPAGAIGNEQPIVITSEEWRSPDLKVLVLTRHNDPRTGESIYRLANVVRVEPDPALFIVPPDYTVKDTGIRRDDE